MTFHAQVQAALRHVDFSSALYRRANAEQFRSAASHLPGDAPPPSVHVCAMIGREQPEVIRAALAASGGMMVVFDVHRLSPGVDLYVDGDGDLMAAEVGRVPHGLTLWDDLFTIVRGPDLTTVRSSLVGDGERFLATLTHTIEPEFAQLLASSLRTQKVLEVALCMRGFDADFFQPAVDHVQALQSALLKMSKRTSQITAYINFCDYFLGTIIRGPWDEMRTGVAAAEAGNWDAVAVAVQRRAPDSRAMSDLLQPVVESFWPLMAQGAAAVVIDDSVKSVMLGYGVDVDQFQQLMARVLWRRLDATDGYQSDRVIRIDYDASTQQLRVSDTGYPINQPYKVHWLEQQARECGWTAQVTSSAGQNLITLTPPLPK